MVNLNKYLEKILANQYIVQYLFTYALCVLGLFTKDFRFSKANKCKIEIKSIFITVVPAAIVACAIHYVLGKKNDIPIWVLESFMCGVWAREMSAIIFSSRFAESIVKILIGSVSDKINLDDEAKEDLEKAAVKVIEDCENNGKKSNRRSSIDNKDPPDDA